MKRILLASLLAAGVALPGVASAHTYGPDRYDYDRGYGDHYRHHDGWERDYRHDRDRGQDHEIRRVQLAVEHVVVQRAVAIDDERRHN